MLAVECFKRIFDMMHINKVIPFFYKKDIYCLKSFYNSLTAKKIVLLLSVRDNLTLKKKKSLL